jgi:hypothetical protein
LLLGSAPAVIIALSIAANLGHNHLYFPHLSDAPAWRS